MSKNEISSTENRPVWLSIGQAAKYLGVSRDTLRRWEKRGRFKATRSPSNRRFYTQKQLAAIMAGEKTETEKDNQPPINLHQQLLIAGLLSCFTAIVIATLIWLLL